jgi:peptidoglycan-N-acetylglucosamine deacetylase
MKNYSCLLLFLFFVTSCASKSQPATSTPVILPTETATITPTSTPTVTPSPLPTATLPPVLITSGDSGEPYAALTFDLCQDPQYPAGYDVAIVEILQRYGVPATFFMGGDWMRTHPQETQALASNPNFELGNHSWSHPDFTQLTEDEMAQQLETTETMLFELTGRRSTLFRPPFGFSNELTLQVAAQHGFHTVMWDSASGDPDPKFDSSTILAEIQRTAHNGSIIIMHANGRGWHTAEALPSVIEYLQDKGLKLVRVSQLIGLEPAP